MRNRNRNVLPHIVFPNTNANQQTPQHTAKEMRTSNIPVHRNTSTDSLYTHTQSTIFTPIDQQSYIPINRQHTHQSVNNIHRSSPPTSTPFSDPRIRHQYTYRSVKNTFAHQPIHNELLVHLPVQRSKYPKELDPPHPSKFKYTLPGVFTHTPHFSLFPSILGTRILSFRFQGLATVKTTNIKLGIPPFSCQLSVQLREARDLRERRLRARTQILAGQTMLR